MTATDKKDIDIKSVYTLIKQCLQTPKTTRTTYNVCGCCWHLRLNDILFFTCNDIFSDTSLFNRYTQGEEEEEEGRRQAKTTKSMMTMTLCDDA